jgi:DNA polymerase-3 subunit gamma/tau
MDNYLVSARKYRPSTFLTVVGQKALTTTLKNAILSNKLAHAYLFCGPRGVGKTTCARIFAKTINCLSPTSDGEACNQCESCIAMNEQRSFNIHELDAASNNSVDDIRSLIEQVRVPPQIGKYKVYIIDEVHMLSSQAFNAFLKTLEEPPHHAVFILATTEKHKVLPTILSRCQIYDFSRISLTNTVEHLRYVADQEGVLAEDEALNVIAQKADGGMRDALSIFDQVVSYTGGNITYKAAIENLNVLDYEYYFRLTENVLSGNVVDSWLTLNEILSKGFDGQNFLTGFASHFRDLLLCKDEKTAKLFEVGSSIRDRYIEMARRCDTQFLYKAIEWVNDCDMKYRLSRNKRLLMDLLFVYLCQAMSPDSEGDEKKKQLIRPISSPQATPSPVRNSDKMEYPPKQTNHPPVAQNASQPASSTASVPSPRVAQQSEPKASVPQATRKSVSLGGIGVSLSSLSQQKEEKKEERQLAKGDQCERFTQQQLTEQWEQYIKTMDEGLVLLNQAMVQCSPILLTASDFEVVVNNPGQKERLEEHATDILTALRINLKNFTIRMQIRISENNEKKLAFTADEKFKLMAEQNPALMRLKNEFDLELD